MTKSKTYCYPDLRAQARIEKLMDKQNIPVFAETVVDGLAYGAFVTMVCLFGVLV